MARRERPEVLGFVAAAALPAGWERYYKVVRRIPRGRVATYGGVAEMAGQPRSARQVGYAMAALHGAEHDVPWHRVLGARSRGRAHITIKDPTGAAIQMQRLEAEGVVFDKFGNISLEEFGYRPGDKGRPKPKNGRAAPAKKVVTRKRLSK